MLRMSLRWKILLSSSALLVLLIVAMLVFVNDQAETFVNERIAAELEQGRQRIGIVETERLAGLRLTAQLVASFPELKALLDSIHVPTIRDFLLQYQQEIPGTDLLMVLDPTGRVVTRTDVEAAEPVADAGRGWVQPALASRSATGVLVTPRGVYSAAAFPAAAGDTVFGFVIAGASIDHAYARSLRALSQDEVILVGDRILGSTLPEERLPWRSQAEWERAVGRGRSLGIVAIAGETYAALAFPLGATGEARLLAVVLRSRDVALAPYRRIQFGLLVLGLVVVAAGISASVFLARTVTAHVGKLVEGTLRVAAGNFDTPIDIRSGDEIGDLGRAFNSMIRGLRERADMQKFVSQSTVEMIQARSQKIASAGERKLLTIFFSDIRGFTLMSENRAPEEVVQILNACLSLQADRVKEFQGDVDKYVGDSVVALFSGEDSALQAVRCAIEIEKALDAYNAARPGGGPIYVGIGIVTGEVILGSIGSEDRRDFTAIGSNVNLCARLCSAAGPREILVSESSYQRVRSQVAAEKLEPLQMKGFSGPVSVYRIPIQ